MYSTHHLLVFVILIVSEGHTLRIDYVSSPEENTRQFIQNENMESRKLVKSDLLTFLANLTKTIETINHQLMNVSKNQEKLNSSLSEINRKQEKSDQIAQELVSETKIISSHQQLLYAQQEYPHGDNVLTLVNTSGEISYDKNLRTISNRRFWILEKTMSVDFIVHHMQLGANSHLTFTGIDPRGNKTEVSFNSTTQTEGEFTVKGCVIVVTLIMKDISPQTHPHFKIRYTKSDRADDSRLYANKVITTEGLQLLSYPKNRTHGLYDNNASYMWLIAPFSGKPFEISLKFIETENCLYDFLKIFSIRHQQNASTYELQGRQGKPEQNNTVCGKDKKIIPPELIGYSTASILFFTSDNTNRRKGFQVQFKTFELPQELPIFP